MINPIILVTADRIRDIEDIVNSIEFIKSLSRPLIIFSPHFENEPLSVLIYNKKKADLNVK